MDDQAFPRAVSTPQQPKRPKVLIVLAVSLVVLGIVLFAGSQFLGVKQEKKDVESAKVAPTAIIAPSDTPVPTQSASPTPVKPTSQPTKALSPTSAKPTSDPVDKTTGLDRSTLSVEVLNGSGVVGVAGKMSSFLKDLGYTISSTGNADNYDYQGVTVTVKSVKSKFLPLLQKDLQGTYTVSNTSSDLASGSADAVVIVGK
ncbi:MAG: LytR C-terminal domain-containing protein [Candidatus Levybacteria bacterium]|nr:LytR C-terminal domain-containing protein [Candidatus Levybacteria bacterium]